MTRALPYAPWSLFAGLLAMVGLPIYLHAPKVYADAYGVNLAVLGTVLFGLRMLDVVQDPLLGWLAGRLKHARALAAGVGLAVLALAMLGLFAVTPPIAPILWFALTLAALFTAYSFLVILFYAQGVAKATGDEHVRLAAWRESGGLLGLCLAAILPTVMITLDRPMLGYAVAVAVLAVLAGWVMRGEWQAVVTPTQVPLLRDRGVRRLLVLAMVNALPLAICATLFLFFVETRIGAPALQGPLLLLFFLSAAAAAPLWARLALRFGMRETLLLAMILAVTSFAGTATLGAGDVLPFALVCIASGAANGADVTLLPALFAGRLTRVGASSSQGFGLWNFANKLPLALAALVMLPLLDRAGLSADPVPAAALQMLTICYAVLPCLLKLAAIAIVLAAPVEETSSP